MAEVAGKEGSVTFTNVTASVKAFTVEHTADVEDITDFADGSAGYKKYKTTLKDWTATLELNWDSANTAGPGDEGALVLNVDSGSSYTGNAIITGISVSETVEGIVTSTITMQGSGALVLS